MIWWPVPAAALLLGITALGAWADDGDPVRGETVLQYCYSCHSVQPDETNLQGPSLYGVVGGKIASQQGFAYSPALRAFAQREERWSEALLDRDLPLKFHPAADRASVGDTPIGATGARGQRAEPVRCAA